MFIVLDFAQDADALYMAQIVTEELSGGKAQTLAVGDATDCVKALLARLSLAELDAVQRQHIWTARTAALDRAKEAPANAVERDEDGDVIAEPTPTIAVDAMRGVREALDEADGDG